MGSPEFIRLLERMKDLHERKCAGYASDNVDTFINFRQCERFGITAAQGVATRMSDKYSRLISLWIKPENDQVGEAIEDTLMDLASYALILICLLDEQKHEYKGHF